MKKALHLVIAALLAGTTFFPLFLEQEAAGSHRARRWVNRAALAATYPAVASDEEIRTEGGLLERFVRLPGRAIDQEWDCWSERLRRRLFQRVPEPNLWVWRAPGGSYWYTDYAMAYRAAEREGKQLLVYFVPEDAQTQYYFEQYTLADPAVTQWLNYYYVGVRLPYRAAHVHGPQYGYLLSDPSFYYMGGRPGFAVIDLLGSRTDLHGYVNFVRPFKGTDYPAPFEMATILGLPRATLTQRTMIWAVRMHPERPQSANGNPSPYLLAEAERHSAHQASIQVQGHHGWDSRFHQISGRLGSIYSAQEVVAESWGWEDLVDAAKECVHSWRQSSGHWSAVRAPHAFYGYDMKQGANGKWYGTGIFGNASGSSSHWAY